MMKAVMMKVAYCELTAEHPDPKLANVFVDCPYCHREEFFTIARGIAEIAVSCQNAPDDVYNTYLIQRPCLRCGGSGFDPEAEPHDTLWGPDPVACYDCGGWGMERETDF